MSDGPATLTVQNSDVFHNGAGDGYSHNFYLQGDSATLIGNHIHDSNGGQNVKLRSRYAALFYNLIENAGQYEMDLIQGPYSSSANANAVLVGNVIARPSASGNDSQVILFGTDDAAQAARNGSLYAVNNTFVLKNPANHLFHAIQPVVGSQILFENNIVFATVAGTALAADATTAGILSGSHNWVGSNVTLAGTLTQTLTGTDPGFVGAIDYHLQATAPVIDQGLANPTYVDGSGITQSAVPSEEFSAPQGTVVRPPQANPDLGAFESVSSDGVPREVPMVGASTPGAGRTRDTRPMAALAPASAAAAAAAKAPACRWSACCSSHARCSAAVPHRKLDEVHHSDAAPPSAMLVAAWHFLCLSIHFTTRSRSRTWPPRAPSTENCWGVLRDAPARRGWTSTSTGTKSPPTWGPLRRPAPRDGWRASPFPFLISAPCSAGRSSTPSPRAWNALESRLSSNPSFATPDSRLSRPPCSSSTRAGTPLS